MFKDWIQSHPAALLRALSVQGRRASLLIQLPSPLTRFRPYKIPSRSRPQERATIRRGWKRRTVRLARCRSPSLFRRPSASAVATVCPRADSTLQTRTHLKVPRSPTPRATLSLSLSFRTRPPPSSQAVTHLALTSEVGGGRRSDRGQRKWSTVVRGNAVGGVLSRPPTEVRRVLLRPVLLRPEPENARGTGRLASVRATSVAWGSATEVDPTLTVFRCASL